MGGTDTGTDKKRPITIFSVFVQNRLGNRYNLILVMGWSEIGFDTDTGFRNFFGFCWKSIGESIGVLKPKN